MMPSHGEIVFKQLFEELKAMKQQQWAITNYGVLILAAIYAVKLPGVDNSQSWLKGLAIMTAVSGSAMLLLVQSHMAGTRLRLDEVHKTYFTRNDRWGVGLTDEEISRSYCAHFRRGLGFTFPLMFVLWIGAILVCLAL